MAALFEKSFGCGFPAATLLVVRRGHNGLLRRLLQALTRKMDYPTLPQGWRIVNYQENGLSNPTPGLENCKLPGKLIIQAYPGLENCKLPGKWIIQPYPRVGELENCKLQGKLIIQPHPWVGELPRSYPTPTQGWRTVNYQEDRLADPTPGSENCRSNPTPGLENCKLPGKRIIQPYPRVGEL